MNKFGLLFFVAAVVSYTSANTCTTGVGDLFKGINFIDMKDACTKQTEEQIIKEITASLKYLSMAAYFSKDSVDRPGFAKFFFDAASEEREHATKLIEYLSMRGRYLNPKNDDSPIAKFDISALVRDSEGKTVMGANLVDLSATEKDKSTSGLIALQNALKLEVEVTKSIRKLIKACEEDDGFNHFHFVDYLTGDFLEEQYNGQRDIAGKLSTLGKMVQSQGAELADFLFDKKLL